MCWIRGRNVNQKSGSTRGSADKNLPVCTATQNNKKLLEHAPKPYQAPNQKITTYVCSSMLGWSDRCDGSGWVSPLSVETSCSRQSVSETRIISETGHGVVCGFWAWGGLVVWSLARVRSWRKICTTTALILKPAKEQSISLVESFLSDENERKKRGFFWKKWYCSSYQVGVYFYEIICRYWLPLSIAKKTK